MEPAHHTTHFVIPRIIHYCWFGHGLMPQSQRDNIRHWQQLMPDWTVVRWDEHNFPNDFCPYTEHAYRNHKWAFVSDVCRLHALDTMGGIYLDTDVELFASLDSFLDNRLFSAVEIYPDDFAREGIPMVDTTGTPLQPNASIPYCGFLAAVLGAEPSHPLIKECLQLYQQLPIADIENNVYVIDGLLATHAVKYGFRYVDQLQPLPSMTIYPSSVFSYVGQPLLPESIAYHHNSYTWMPMPPRRRLFYTLDQLHLLKPYRTLKHFLKRKH